MEDFNFGMLLLRTVFFLGIILVLIYLVLKKLLPFLMQAPGLRNRTVRILERVQLDQKRSLLVIEVQDKFYLIGSAEGQINVLMELDREKMNLQSAPAQTASFDEILKKTILKPKSSETSK